MICQFDEFNLLQYVCLAKKHSWRMFFPSDDTNVMSERRNKRWGICSNAWIKKFKNRRKDRLIEGQEARQRRKIGQKEIINFSQSNSVGRGSDDGGPLMEGQREKMRWVCGGRLMLKVSSSVWSPTF